MGRRGKKRQLEVEARYWQLLESGVGTVEACRRVGITRKTGYRWRVEAGGVVPDRLADAVRSNRYLSLTERLRIDTLHRHRVSVREIARRLDRSPSTISRELRRNTARHDRGYDATLAHARARARGARPGRSRLATDAELRAVVQGKLELEWSPEQIAAHLREAFPDRPLWHVCHETIYQALYRGARGGLNRKLTKRLRPAGRYASVVDVAMSGATVTSFRISASSTVRPS
jgi:transposase